MSCNREWFSSFTPLVGKKVRQGDGFLTVEGVGTIPMRWDCSDRMEKRVMLKNVFYVPRLFTNLISTSKVKLYGRFFDRWTDTIRRIDTDEEFGSTRMLNGFGRLNLGRGSSTVALAATSSGELWHRRLGHASLSSIKQTVAHVTGIDISSLNDEKISTCEKCHIAKAH